MKLGTDIKISRRAKGLTQLDLSAFSGLSLRTIQRIENGEVKPSIYSLRKISEVLEKEWNSNNYDTMDNTKRKARRNYLALIFAGLMVFICGLYLYLTKRIESEIDVINLVIRTDDFEDFAQFDIEGFKNIVSLDLNNTFNVKLIYDEKDSIISVSSNSLSVERILTTNSFEEDVRGFNSQLNRLISAKINKSVID